MEWEPVRPGICNPGPARHTGDHVQVSGERSKQLIKEIEDRFHATVREAHKEYDIHPVLDRINIRMEDGPGVTASGTHSEFPTLTERTVLELLARSPRARVEGNLEQVAVLQG